MNKITDKTDYLICGAGIAGLTIARELIKRKKGSVTIIEKEERVALHASGRNSGILHAGIYYNPDSKKGQTCIEGNRLMKEYCRKKNLPLLENGKVIIANNREDLEALYVLKKRADGCGAGADLISQSKAKAMEPLAGNCIEALFSPETAAVNPRTLCEAIFHDLKNKGVSIQTGCRFTGSSGSEIVETSRGSIRYGKFINAAGAHSDKIAAFFDAGNEYILIPFKGTYKKMTGPRASMIKGNIYPVPDLRNPFLGIHFSRSTDGNVYIGPTAIPAFGRENYGILNGLDPEAFSILLWDLKLILKNKAFRSVARTESLNYFKSYFLKNAKKLIKDLSISEISSESKCGIRPQLIDKKNRSLVMDFVIEERKDSVHLLNSISPAFTSSMKMAEIIVDNYC